MTAIPVPVQLRNLHPLLEATRVFYGNVTPDEDGRMRPGPTEGVAHLIVSKAALRRALLYLQAIFAEAQRRGYDVAPSHGYESTGVAVVIRGHPYAVAMAELHERVPLTVEEVQRWRKRNERELRWNPRLKQPTHRSVPNGYLKVISRDWHGGRSSWSEGPRGPLERKLPALFDELERRAEADDVRAAQRSLEAEERRQRALERAERERLQRIEQARRERLGREVAAWRLATDVRGYVAALRERLGVVDEGARLRVSAWCVWAEKWAASSDPVASLHHVAGLDGEADSGPLRDDVYGRAFSSPSAALRGAVSRHAAVPSGSVPVASAGTQGSRLIHRKADARRQTPSSHSGSRVGDARNTLPERRFSAVV